MIQGKLRLTIPNPHKNEIGVDLFSRILRQTGISKEQWTLVAEEEKEY